MSKVNHDFSAMGAILNAPDEEFKAIHYLEDKIGTWYHQFHDSSYTRLSISK